MNILDPLPSLLMLPSGVKAGKLYSVLPEDGSGDFNVDRNSTATRVNADGLIEEVQPNVPRIDYSTGEPMLLVEGGSTNLVPYSEDLRNSSIYASNGSVIVDKVGDADVNVFKVTHTIDLSDSRSRAFLRVATEISSEEKHVFHFKIKATTSNEVGKTVFVRNERTDNDYVPIVLTENWEKYSTTLSVTPEYTFFNSGLEIRTNINTISSIEYLIKEVQIEQGSKATSYIPTTGSIVTRLADNIFTIFPQTGDAVITFADGATQTITGNQGDTLTLPQGLIKKVEML